MIQGNNTLRLPQNGIKWAHRKKISYMWLSSQL